MNEYFKMCGEEVKKIYDELVEKIGSDAIEVINSKAPFSDGAATFVDKGDGTFIIYIEPKTANDVIVSHELLHIYARVFDIIPSMVSCSLNAEPTIVYIALMLTDFTSHKWIIGEQRRRCINGLQDHIDIRKKSILNLKEEESGIAVNDFLFIKKFYVFLNDFPEFKDEILPIVAKKYPNTYKTVKELIEIELEDEIETPFFLRRKILNILKIWQRIFKEYFHFNIEIKCTLVFREVQLGTCANASIGLHRVLNGFFCESKNGKQRCSDMYKMERAKEIDIDNKNLSLENFLEKYNINYYIDERNGEWNYGLSRN